MRWFILFVTVTAILGCTQVKTDVEAYSAIEPSDEIGGIFIAAYNSEDAKSLQWRRNAGVLKGALIEKGFDVVDSRVGAESIMYVGFAVDEGETVQSTYSIPQYGVTGYSGARTTGTIYGNSINANTTYTPTYGVTGYQTGTARKTVYTRGLVIDMVNTKSGAKEFEAVSISRGKCSSFSGVARPIIDATLQNFPAGKVGSVIVTSEINC